MAANLHLMESRFVDDLINLQISVYAEINQKTSAALVQRGCEYEIGDRQREPDEASKREKKPPRRNVARMSATPIVGVALKL